MDRPAMSYDKLVDVLYIVCMSGEADTANVSHGVILRYKGSILLSATIVDASVQPDAAWDTIAEATGIMKRDFEALKSGEKMSLESEFLEFLNTLKPYPEDNLQYGDGTFFYSKEIGFDDLNLEIDYNNKALGVRSDDNFWQEAFLPYKFRFLKPEFLIKTIWEKAQVRPTAITGRRSKERDEWFAKEWVSDRRDSLVHMDICRVISNVSIRRELLKQLPSDHPRYKEIYNFKMKKRKGWVKRVNKKSASSRCLSFPNNSISFVHLTKEQLARHDAEMVILKKEKTALMESLSEEEKELHKYTRRKNTSVEIEIYNERHKQ